MSNIKKIDSKALNKLSKNLILLRAKNNKSIYQVHKDLGFAVSYLAGIEHQIKSPSLKNIDILAEYYGVEVYELFI